MNKARNVKRKAQKHAGLYINVSFSFRSRDVKILLELHLKQLVKKLESVNLQRYICMACEIESNLCMLKMCLYVCLVKLRGNVTSKSWVVPKCFINTAASFEKIRLFAFFYMFL